MVSVIVTRKVRKGKRDKFYTAKIAFGKHRQFSRSTGEATERAALAKAKKIAKEIETNELRYNHQDTITVDMLFGHWWTSHAQSQRSAYDMKLRAREVQDLLGDNTPIAYISDDRVSDLVIELYEGSKGERKPATVNRHVSILSKAMTVGKKHKDWRTKLNQFGFVDWGSHNQIEPRERVVWLLNEELEQLINLLPLHISQAFEFAVYTGARLNELKTLTVGKVNLREQHAEVWAKGGNFRPVFLSSAACLLLSDLIPADADKGHVIFNLKNRRKHFEKARAEIDRLDFRWHDARHHHATILRQAGIPIEIVQRALGHSDLSTTMKYAHVDGSEVLRAVETIPALRERAAPNVVQLKRT